MAADDALDRPPAGYGYGPPPPPSPLRPTSSARRRLPVRPSPVFGALVAIMLGSGAFLWTAGPGESSTAVYAPMRVAVFVFVAVGWTVSLCVHEFAHAATAWQGGDRSVEGRGYLTLDPRRYMDRQLSIVLPIVIVLIGGIGLPGGAVMIDRRFIPSRGRRSLVSAAGPLTNLAFALACAAPIEFGWFQGHDALRWALAFLAFLEIAATILNALPVPGLDGFGVIAPWLPDETVASLMPIAQYAFFGIFILLFYSVKANTAFFRFVFHAVALIGVPRELAEGGMLLFRFWQHY